MFGAPVAASLLALDGLLGLAGWQWLFVVEGLPTIALGVYIARTLAPSPAQAAFLTPEEREWLCARNARVKACGVPLCLHAFFGERSALSQITHHEACMLISSTAPCARLLCACMYMRMANHCSACSVEMELVHCAALAARAVAS